MCVCVCVCVYVCVCVCVCLCVKERDRERERCFNQDLLGKPRDYTTGEDQDILQYIKSVNGIMDGWTMTND